MSDFLRSSWSINATVLHDCPPDAFKEGTVHEVRMSKGLVADHWSTLSSSNECIYLTTQQAHYVLMKMRPLIDRPMHLKDCCASEYVSQQVEWPGEVPRIL